MLKGVTCKKSLLYDTKSGILYFRNNTNSGYKYVL